MTPAENRIFEVSYGQAEFDYGVVQALPVSFGTTVHSVRLSYTGTGVVFQVSTDGGTKWQKIEPGREVMLDEPGTEILVKVLLLIDPATVLYDYRIDINPYHDMSFTGKFLEPEIGLIYFGGRWYEPGIGRWVTVDPSEDGINWYGYCNGNPINFIDPNGQIMQLAQMKYFLQGMGDGLYETGVGLLTGITIGITMSAITTFAPALAPFVATLNNIMLAAGIAVLGVDIYNTFAYLVKYTGKFLATSPSNGFVRTYGKYFCKALVYTVTGALAAKYIKAKFKGEIPKFGGSTTSESSCAIPELPEGAIGRVEVPQGHKFGTGPYGIEMHQNVAEWLQTQYSGKQFDFRIKPGEKGIDVIVNPGPDGIVPEFRMAEIKPRTPSGYKTFMRQMGKWGYSFEDVVVFTYDDKGYIYKGW